MDTLPPIIDLDGFSFDLSSIGNDEYDFSSMLMPLQECQNIQNNNGSSVVGMQNNGSMQNQQQNSGMHVNGTMQNGGIEPNSQQQGMLLNQQNQPTMMPGMFPNQQPVIQNDETNQGIQNNFDSQNQMQNGSVVNGFDCENQMTQMQIQQQQMFQNQMNQVPESLMSTPNFVNNCMNSSDAMGMKDGETTMGIMMGNNINDSTDVCTKNMDDMSMRQESKLNANSMEFTPSGKLWTPRMESYKTSYTTDSEFNVIDMENNSIGMNMQNSGMNMENANGGMDNMVGMQNSGMNNMVGMQSNGINIGNLAEIHENAIMMENYRQMISRLESGDSSLNRDHLLLLSQLLQQTGTPLTPLVQQSLQQNLTGVDGNIMNGGMNGGMPGGNSETSSSLNNALLAATLTGGTTTSSMNAGNASMNALGGGNDHCNTINELLNQQLGIGMVNVLQNSTPMGGMQNTPMGGMQNTPMGGMQNTPLGGMQNTPNGMPGGMAGTPMGTPSMQHHAAALQQIQANLQQQGINLPPVMTPNPGSTVTSIGSTILPPPPPPPLLGLPPAVSPSVDPLFGLPLLFGLPFQADLSKFMAKGKGRGGKRSHSYGGKDSSHGATDIIDQYGDSNFPDNKLEKRYGDKKFGLGAGKHGQKYGSSDNVGSEKTGKGDINIAGKGDVKIFYNSSSDNRYTKKYENDNVVGKLNKKGARRGFSGTRNYGSSHDYLHTSTTSFNNGLYHGSSSSLLYNNNNGQVGGTTNKDYPLKGGSRSGKGGTEYKPNYNKIIKSGENFNATTNANFNATTNATSINDGIISGSIVNDRRKTGDNYGIMGEMVSSSYGNAARNNYGRNGSSSYNPEIERLFQTNEYLDRIDQVAKDARGCRLLVSLLHEKHSPVINVGEMFEALMKCNISELMIDGNANFFIQNFLDSLQRPEYAHFVDAILDHFIDEEAKCMMNAKDVVGAGFDQQFSLPPNFPLGSSQNPTSFLSVCIDVYGTRVMQKLLDIVYYLGVPEQMNKIKSLIQSQPQNVISLVEDLNGTHVIQKVIKFTSDKSFIFEKLADNIVELSCHKHGCCVLQRCFDVGTPAEKKLLKSKILGQVNDLIQDPFANYVVQHFMQSDNANSSPLETIIVGARNVVGAGQNDCGADVGEEYVNFADQVIERIVDNLYDLCCQKFASNVIEQCLEFSTVKYRAILVRTLISDDSIDLPNLLKDRYGNYVVQKALTTTENDGDIFFDLVYKLKPAVRHHNGGIALKIMKRYPSLFVPDVGDNNNMQNMNIGPPNNNIMGMNMQCNMHNNMCNNGMNNCITNDMNVCITNDMNNCITNDMNMNNKSGISHGMNGINIMQNGMQNRMQNGMQNGMNYVNINMNNGMDNCGNNGMNNVMDNCGNNGMNNVMDNCGNNGMNNGMNNGIANNVMNIDNQEGVFNGDNCQFNQENNKNCQFNQDNTNLNNFNNENGTYTGDMSGLNAFDLPFLPPQM